MTWTYTGAPATVDLDALRFLIGDTDSTDPQISDGEAAFVLAAASDPWTAGAAACRAIAARYARQVTTSAEGVSSSASERYRHYLDLAGQLAAQAAAFGSLPAGFCLPVITGIDPAEIVAVRSDPTRINGRMRVGQDDFGPSGPQGCGDPTLGSGLLP